MTPLDFATLILAALGLGVMLCRLDALKFKMHRIEVILLHVLLAWLAIVSGAHAWEGMTDTQDIVAALVPLVWVMVSLPTWRDGPPRNASSRPVPLDDDELEHYRGGWL